jgi:hypothetical protein
LLGVLLEVMLVNAMMHHLVISWPFSHLASSAEIHVVDNYINNHALNELKPRFNTLIKNSDPTQEDLGLLMLDAQKAIERRN